MSPIEAHLLFSVFCWSKSNQNVANKRYDSKIKCDYETILASLTVTLTIPMSSQSLFALFQLNFQILATYCWICPFVFSMMYADDIHWYDTELNIYNVHLNIYFSVAIFLFLNSFFSLLLSLLHPLILLLLLLLFDVNQCCSIYFECSVADWIDSVWEFMIQIENTMKMRFSWFLNTYTSRSFFLHNGSQMV